MSAPNCMQMRLFTETSYRHSTLCSSRNLAMSPIPKAYREALDAASLPTAGATVTGNVLTLSNGQRLFARTVTFASNIAQARGEAEGLHYMGLTSALASRLYRFHFTASAGGDGGDRDKREAVVLSEYLDMGGRMDEAGQRQLARKLAEMHRPLGPEQVEEDTKRRKETGLPVQAAIDPGRLNFGFPVPTHCGVTEQDNTWEGDWATFFRDRRLGNMVRRIGDAEVAEEWDRMQAR